MTVKSKKTASGLILIDKHPGPTSHDAVSAVRRMLGGVKAGHTGTLDPMASGLLVIVVGKATKLAPFIHEDPKVYEGCMMLGVTTDSMDMDGEVKSEMPCASGPEEVREAIASLAGEFEQVPPMFSALKHHGVPLYRYARRGEEVPRKGRIVRVYRAEMTSFRERGARAEARFTVACSPGTYVRELAERVGEALACGGALSALRRTAAGPFRIEEALTLQQLEERIAHGEQCLLPLETALTGYRRVEVTGEAAPAARNGAPLSEDMLCAEDADISAGETVAVFAGGSFLGMHRVSSVAPFTSRAVRMM